MQNCRNVTTCGNPEIVAQRFENRLCKFRNDFNDQRFKRSPAE
jgi:hypothetical protein